MTKSTSFVRVLKEDLEFPGEFMLDLGDDLVNQLGWKIGDTVTWTDNQDGTWTLTKKTASSE
jgi:ABC-type lipoprotein release transport system permease subunit